MTALTVPKGGFVLERGGILEHIDVAWESCGLEKPENDNVIFICHALTGDAHVAGRYAEETEPSGWWEGMIGPGRAIDTNRFRVVCANVLGGCKGTTGPSSINPATGKPYASHFPHITIGDTVMVYRALLKELGINHLAGLIGGSFGGIQVLDWITSYPDAVDNAIMVASGACLNSQALAFDIVGRNAILEDPDWNGGEYYGTPGPVHGLSSARQLAHITYLSAAMLNRKFGRRLQESWISKGRDFLAAREKAFGTNFSIESYLDHQAEKFIARFDANSYLQITHALDNYNVADKFGGSLDEACRHIKANLLLVSLSGDWLFEDYQSKEIASSMIAARKHVSYAHLDVKVGHDGFLTHIQELSQVFGSFLNARHMAVTELRKAMYAPVVKMVKDGSRVLDIGCGSGQLLTILKDEKNVTGTGIEIDLGRLCNALHANNDVLFEDADNELSVIPDKTYDQAILSETLQAMKRPKELLKHLLRVADEAIVAFPNFGAWSVRLQLAITGRMPVGKCLPFEWYDTPNIHLFTLKDFRKLCASEGIRILEIKKETKSWLGAFFVKIGLGNFGAEHVVCRIGRKDG